MTKEVSLAKAKHRLMNWLATAERPKKADVIFVLGGDQLEPARRAADLYWKGYAPSVAFISIGGTFGGQTVFGMPEHEKYLSVLIEKGIPKKVIFAAGITSNTLMEAQEAAPFLRGRGIDPRRVILCSRPVHQRRAWATFQKQNADVEFINCPGKELFHPEDASQTERMLQEVERMERYARQGDLIEQTVPPEILKAIEIIRRG